MHVEGFTQNAAESANSVLWTRCPKGTFVGNTALRAGLNMGVITYNDGQCGLLLVMKELGMCIGQHSLRAYTKMDNVRVELSVKRRNELEKRSAKVSGSKGKSKKRTI